MKRITKYAGAWAVVAMALTATPALASSHYHQDDWSFKHADNKQNVTVKQSVVVKVSSFVSFKSADKPRFDHKKPDKDKKDHKDFSKKKHHNFPKKHRDFSWWPKKYPLYYGHDYPRPEPSWSSWSSGSW